MMIRVPNLAVVFLFLNSICALGEEWKPFVSQITTVVEQGGGRLSWSSVHNKVAIDLLSRDFWFDVFVMNPNGGDMRPITQNADPVPQKHNGQPSWHPSGKWIIFQAQDESLEGFPKLGKAFNSILTGPGSGVNNNLWLCDAEGKQFWQLTHVRQHKGVLHPHFSPDGQRLIWSELGKGGYWSIQLADFSFEGGLPRLTNIRTLRPRNLAFYETHGFSPDGKAIIFTATAEKQDYFGLEVYVMDLASNKIRQLTDDKEWDEHAHFSHDGKWIVWSSSRDIPQPKTKVPKIDYWIMCADGSQPRRITFLNKPDAEEGEKYIASDFDWSPDGNAILAYIQHYRGKGSYRQLTLHLQLDWSALSQ